MPKKKKNHLLERWAYNFTYLVGTPMSVIVHTVIFGIFFILILVGYDVNKIMLALTTLVSLEAIYLSLLIQMTVNRHGKHLRDVKEDIEDLQEDMEELTEEDEKAG